MIGVEVLPNGAIAEAVSHITWFLPILLGTVAFFKLTEIEDWSVLLIEAGGDETELSDVPLLAANLQLTQLDWKYKAEPQDTACLGG
ncbi:hypothetical protein QTP88_001353 [Uroleucon formosanum]